MIETVHFPFELTGRELDYYLSVGWYRMGQTIFTTHFIPVKDRIHPVFWLRILVQQVKYGKRQKRLFAINKKFSSVVKPFLPSAELEELYSQYRANVNFDAPPSVNGFLLSDWDEEFRNIYDTHVVELRDEGRLIAAGIFDNGENSMAGIMNFYHPDYASKSLGKYLMLLKINIAIAAGKTYYYPGYIVSGYPKFDYKLFPDKERTEWYDPIREKWISFTELPYPSLLDLQDDE